MQLFYQQNIEPNQTQYVIDEAESKHIIKVLRKKNGDVLMLTNGKGDLFHTRIIDDHYKRCTVNIEQLEQHQPSRHQVHLAVAPTKMMDRYEWFVEKATEIGVTHIHPIICEHSERSKIKLERLQRVLITAMKQSLKFHLPEILEPIHFTKFIENKPEGNLYIAHCNDAQQQHLKTHPLSNADTTVLIGPEGDFSSKEIEQALQVGFIPVTLGKSRLRTETAAVVACHTIALAYE